MFPKGFRKKERGKSLVAWGSPNECGSRKTKRITAQWRSSHFVVLKELRWHEWRTRIPYCKGSVKEPQPGWLKTAEICRFTVLGAKSLKSGVGRVGSLGKLGGRGFHSSPSVSGGPERSLACIWRLHTVFLLGTSLPLRPNCSFL